MNANEIINKAQNEANEAIKVIETNESKIQSICFPVKKVLSVDVNPAFKYTTENKNTIIADINNEKHVLHSCSDRYELVQNSEFLPELYDVLGNKFGKENLKFSVRNFQNCAFEFNFVVTSNDFYIGGNPNDKLNFKISGVNSYNGKQNYNFKFGNEVYRQICSNGLHAWVLNELFAVKGKHTEKIRKNLVLFSSELDNALQNNIFEKIAKSFEPMINNEVGNWKDVVKTTVKAAGLNTQESYVQNIFDIIENESKAHYNGIVNTWLLYNGINQNLFESNKKATQQALETKDKKVYELLTADLF
jgi:hypothetical protein